MFSCLVVLCRFLVVPRRVLVMFRCFAMMLCHFLRHKFLSSRVHSSMFHSDSPRYYTERFCRIASKSVKDRI